MKNDQEFKFLLNKIMRNRDIDFSQYRPQVLKRRIQHRFHLTGCKTFWEYIVLLNRDPQEYDRLIDCLTINVSQFFRDQEVFSLLGEIVIPEIVAQKQSQEAKKIRAWSCGAAFGEEAYSISVLFCEVLGNSLSDFDIKIVGTDIDKKALEEAPWGSYPRESLRKMEPYLLFKYFTQVQNNNVSRYVVSDRARELVTFINHNVVSDSPNQGMDLVLCRNLLIYFQKELQEKALSNLYNALNPGGFLILGKTEFFPLHMLNVFETVDLRERIYRKKGGKK
jgi:chemotaxis protein methyltransferase CheR